MTSVAVPALRHPLLLAKALVALDLLSEGRVVAGIGPGSSNADYDAVGLDFAERWQRLDEAARLLRHVLRGAPLTGPTRHYPAPPAPLSPAPFRADGVPLWIASWGSPAGLRRVVRHGDGWLASAYNTDPAAFAAGRAQLPAELPVRRGDHVDVGDRGRRRRAPAARRRPGSPAPAGPGPAARRRSASGRRSVVPSSWRGTPRPAAIGCTSGRSATRSARWSSSPG